MISVNRAAAKWFQKQTSHLFAPKTLAIKFSQFELTVQNLNNYIVSFRREGNCTSKGEQTVKSLLKV